MSCDEVHHQRPHGDPCAQGRVDRVHELGELADEVAELLTACGGLGSGLDELLKYEAQERVEALEFGPAPGRRAAPPREARRAKKKTVRIRLPVARPRLVLACKDDVSGRGGKSLLRRELASAVALDALFGNSGSIFLELYEAGLVDDAFSAAYSADWTYGFAMAGGETDDTTKLRRALEKKLDAALDAGLDKGAFDRVRNKALGAYARAFNSPDRIAHMLVGHHFRGTTVADYRETLFKLTRPEVNRRMRALLDPAARCYSLVEPR